MTGIGAVQYQRRTAFVRAVLVLLAMAIGQSVRADTTRDTLSAIAKCSAIEESVARLRCFDRVAPQAKAALEPSPEDFGKPPVAAPQAEQISAKVREVFKTARGRAVFVLDNGQTWRQIDGDDSQVAEPEPGDPPLNVTIAKGAFGSYNLTIDGRNALVKVRRVE